MSQPPWATQQLSEKHCIALAAWTDNEIARLQRVRKWVTTTYMREPLVMVQPGYQPTFTMNDALNELLNQRRGADKTLIALLKKIAVELENEYYDRRKVQPPKRA